MTSEVVSISTLVGSNYLSWKIKMNDVIRSNNLWRLVKNDKMKPTNAKYLEIWEYICDQVRGLIGKKCFR